MDNYTVSQVVKLLGITKQRVGQLMKKGLLNYKPAEPILISGAELQRFKQNRRTAGRPKKESDKQ